MQDRISQPGPPEGGTAVLREERRDAVVVLPL